MKQARPTGRSPTGRSRSNAEPQKPSDDAIDAPPADAHVSIRSRNIRPAGLDAHRRPPPAKGGPMSQTSRANSPPERPAPGGGRRGRRRRRAHARPARARRARTRRLHAIGGCRRRAAPGLDSRSRDAERLLNTLMFVPLGATIALLLHRRLWPLAILVGFAMSAAVEYAQPTIPGRVPDAADVFWNTVGAAIGVVLVTGRPRSSPAERLGSAPPASGGDGRPRAGQRDAHLKAALRRAATRRACRRGPARSTPRPRARARRRHGPSARAPRRARTARSGSPRPPGRSPARCCSP